MENMRRLHLWIQVCFDNKSFASIRLIYIYIYHIHSPFFVKFYVFFFRTGAIYKQTHNFVIWYTMATDVCIVESIIKSRGFMEFP